jgi:hypothetical protein
MTKPPAPQPSQRGNILGNVRAEADSLLDRAFIETADYLTLVATTDHNFVVGRRGSGKTALFERVSSKLGTSPRIFLSKTKPEEHDILDLQTCLRAYGLNKYRSARATARLCWRLYLLFVAVHFLAKHWKHGRGEAAEFLAAYRGQHDSLLRQVNIAVCVDLITQSSVVGTQANAIPGAIARKFEIEALQTAVTRALLESGHTLTVLFDALDEGWEPTQVATAVLGGLALAVADMADRGTGIFGLVFMRDNIFRASAHLDSDYSRHIEGASIRLRWDEEGLLHLVAARLRAALSFDDIDNDIRVWNRFAQRGLKDREGFRRCLRYTLLRPRDLLVLLNRAYQLARSKARAELIDDDIEESARLISDDRLSDMLKEYAVVFPGLRDFVEVFRNTTPFESSDSVIDRLNAALAGQSYDHENAADFAVLGSGDEIFLALYSVGFLGISDPEGRGYIFCHDGSRSSIDTSKRSTVAVHPCYWKALDIKPRELDPDLLPRSMMIMQCGAIPRLAICECANWEGLSLSFLTYRQARNGRQNLRSGFFDTLKFYSLVTLLTQSYIRMAVRHSGGTW